MWLLSVGGKEIHTTGEHPFFAEGHGWKPLAELAVGDRLLGENGDWLTIEALEDTGKYETVYNLRVSEAHTYFVGELAWGWSVWAHNNNSTCGGNASEQVEGSEALPMLRRGVNEGEPNLGLVRRVEKPKTDERARRYEEAAPGRVLLENGDSNVPALVFNNPNRHGRARDVSTWDGIDGTTLIDRKLSVTTRSKQLKDLRRMSEAIEQNSETYSGRIEVPTKVEAKRVRRILREQGITNLKVKVVKEPASPAEGNESS